MNSSRSTAPIFIVGYMHSGTTLLHSILRANPAVYRAAYETKYFEYAPTVRHVYPDLHDDHSLRSLILFLVDVIENGRVKTLRGAPVGYTPPDVALPEEELGRLLDQARQDRTYGGVFRLVFDHLAHRAGKTRWIEKTPQHIFFVDEIRRAIPDALFVEMVRDPRDALASKKKRLAVVWTTDSYRPEDRPTRALEKVYDPLWDALAWRLAVRAMPKVQGITPDQFISIRYEDLIADPESTVQKLCTFADLPFTPAMLEVSWINAADGNRTAQKGFVSDTIGRWMQTLTPAEVALCQSVTGADMRRLHYAPVPVAWRARAGIPRLLVGSGVEFFTRLYKRWRLGGRTYMMNTLKNYGRQLARIIRRA